MKNKYKIQEGYTIVEVLTALILFSLCIVITTTFFQLIQSSTLVKNSQVYQLAVNKMEELLSENNSVGSTTETVDRWVIKSYIIDEQGLLKISVTVYRKRNQHPLYSLMTYKIANNNTKDEI